MAERNLAVVNGNNALASDDMFSDARVEMIRSQIAKGAPDDIFVAFLDIAKRRNLDPLAKQISLIKFGGQFTITTTIDGYRAIAEQTGQYVGSDAPVFTYAGATTPAGKKAPDTATVTVHKLINGHAYPFSATVYFEEYSTGMNNWSTMPRTMLAKVAESHALRKAFPAVMSGMYEESEMDQAIEGTARVVESPSRPVSQPNPLQRLLDVAKGAGISEEDLELQATAILKKASLEDVLPADLRKLTEAIESRPDNARAFYQDLRAKAGKSEVMAQVNAEIDGDDTPADDEPEIDPETGEVIPPAGSVQGELIDMPDTDTDPDPAKWRS